MLKDLKTYLPNIVYSILGLGLLYVIYTMYSRFKSGAMAVGGVLSDTNENNQISTNTGLDATRVQQLRGVSRAIAYELETLKDMGYFDKLKHIQLDSDTIEILMSIKSSAEMLVVKNFYNSIFTNNRDLLTDLKDVLSASDINKIPYVSSLY